MCKYFVFEEFQSCSCKTTDTTDFCTSLEHPGLYLPESLPHMAIKSHFVAFPMCTFDTKRSSCALVASWDIASLFVETKATPLKSAVWHLCGLRISTFPIAGKTGFQNTQELKQNAAIHHSKACNCILLFTIYSEHFYLNKHKFLHSLTSTSYFESVHAVLT